MGSEEFRNDKNHFIVQHIKGQPKINSLLVFKIHLSA